MNWGKGLIIGLGLMMSFIIVLVVMMFRSPDDSFDKDYYEKGLAYDEIYLHKQQVLNDDAKPLVKLEAKQMLIQLKALDSGIVSLQRPSNHLLDQKSNIQNKESYIPTEKLIKGEWKVIVEWTYQSKKYLYEQNIYIQ